MPSQSAMRSTAGAKPGDMLSFPNCKINLGLRILRRREDGFHDIETVFHPIPVKDVLELIRDVALSFTSTGTAIPGDPDTNLCLKAWHLLKKDFPQVQPVRIHLHKHIPIGAGLGGGSSDGAFMLIMLNREFNLDLEQQQLLSYAAQLGSDCPFFIINKTCQAGGRGEQLTPLALDLSSWSVALVNPGIHISTARAFAQCTPSAGNKPVAEIIRQPVSEWKDQLVNDFERPIFRAHPELGVIKEKLYAAGAVYASMTGSGSAIYGLFPKNAGLQMPDASLFPGYFFSLV